MAWWPFGKKHKDAELDRKAHRLFEELKQFWDDDSIQNNAYPEDDRALLEQNAACDQIPASFGEFGRALTNPIPVNGPIGELLYLSRLQTENGNAIAFHRLGAIETVDVFEILSEDGSYWDILYVSMYYPRKSRKTPTGFRSMHDRSRRYLVRGSNAYVDGFPAGITQAARDSAERLLGAPIIDPKLRLLETKNAERPNQHLELARQLEYTSRRNA